MESAFELCAIFSDRRVRNGNGVAARCCKAAFNMYYLSVPFMIPSVLFAASGCSVQSENGSDFVIVFFGEDKL